MAASYKRDGLWVARFQLDGDRRWVPGGPWATKTEAKEAERRFRDRLRARLTEETCASFAAVGLMSGPQAAMATNDRMRLLPTVR